MNWKNRHREDNNGFATHQPVLEKIISLVDGPILELGCGEGSTELIHHYSVEKKIQVLTIESDKQWMERYTYLQNENHEFIANENLNEWENLVDEWTEYFVDESKRWGLVFIDHGEWISRYKCLLKLKDKADYIILHDSCYYPKNFIFGKILEEKSEYQCSKNYPKNCGCCHSINTTKRDYSDTFKYSKEFNSPYGPPTLLGSEKYDIRDLNIDMN